MEELNLQPSTPSGREKIVKGPKALFWYLTLFFSLAVVSFNNGALWFQFINKLMPQEVISGFVHPSFNQSAIKLAIAGLLVATPIFFLFSWLVRKSLKNGTLQANNRIRTWITYVILFLTIVVAVADLIITIFRVLDGDFTLRFLLKAATILIIAAWIFIYYGLEIRSPNSLTKSPLPRLMAIFAGGLIIVSVIAAFFIIESPATARARAYDQKRENNLNNISYAINSYYYQKNRLPEKLDELTDLVIKENLIDPQTAIPYTYQVIGEKEYKLCANFETSNLTETESYRPVPYEFLHETGEKCFELKAKVNLELKPLPLPSID